jgi:hypothetical protein
LSDIEFRDPILPVPQRSVILGEPHTYFVSVRSALGQHLFAEPVDRDATIRNLEEIRNAFASRCHAVALASDALHIVIHLPPLPPNSTEDQLRARWMSAGGRSTMPLARLRQRLSSLSGFMQTLLQRLSRDWNRRHGSVGSLWARRYRACLLADDAALLAAIAWVEEELGPSALVSSRTLRRSASSLLRLAIPPLRIGPDRQWFPADEGLPGVPPPANDDLHHWLARIAAELGPEHRRAYGDALQHGWALGRPESLTGPLARLSRVTGRGRSRRLRHLADDLGLCGVWG